MTLRIEKSVDPGAAAIVLHGWLSGAEVAELERAAEAHGRAARIHIEHLAGADAEGLRALRRLRCGGASLVGASPYIELLLERTATAQDTDPVDSDSIG